VFNYVYLIAILKTYFFIFSITILIFFCRPIKKIKKVKSKNKIKLKIIIIIIFLFEEEYSNQHFN